MTDLELADEIGGLIFDAIKHGDEKHQAWLHDKSHELAPQIIAALRRGHERPPSGGMVMVRGMRLADEMVDAMNQCRLSIEGSARQAEWREAHDKARRELVAILSAAEAEGRKS